MSSNLKSAAEAATRNDAPSAEPFYTIAAAAGILGVHLWALRRAVKRGEIPAYTPFNGRRLVRLSEVVAVIDASRVGGVE